jgi:WD40 repeat protein
LARSSCCRRTAYSTSRGHSGPVSGALELADGRLLTWSWDTTARLWAADGAPGPVLQGHTDRVNGALQLVDSRLLAWSNDKTARLWPFEKSLFAWADEYIERLYPLSPAESCSYYLEPDETCAALRAPR